jgi:RNA-binding protein 5/10
MAILWDLQILNELQHSLRLESLEEVRLIKDKRTGMESPLANPLASLIQSFPTGQSRGFAFAQFADIAHARRFLDRYYPSITLHGTYDPTNAAPAEPTKVRIAYSRERDDKEKIGKSDDDWKCDVVWHSMLVSRALLM